MDDWYVEQGNACSHCDDFALGITFISIHVDEGRPNNDKNNREDEQVPTVMEVIISCPCEAFEDDQGTCFSISCVVGNAGCTSTNLRSNEEIK
jgi:hypothetical protein